MVKVKESTKAEVKAKEELPEVIYHYAIGRRKEATARIRLYVLANLTNVSINGKSYEKGEIVVNEMPVEKYFSGEMSKKRYLEPFRTTNTLNRFVTTVKVEGGGLSGQLGAMIHGISKALVKIDPEKNHSIIKKHGFLTRDPRAKQRRKAGFAGKSRKKKQSPKR